MSAMAGFSARLKMENLVMCVCSLSTWGHRLVKAGLALCGPQHCRVMNDLKAVEVSSALKLSRSAQTRVIYFIN